MARALGTRVSKDVIKLITRFENVGWRVRPVSNGTRYVVYVANSDMSFTVGAHSTDKRAIINATKQAERLGLLEAEAVQAERDDRHRQARIEAATMTLAPTPATANGDNTKVTTTSNESATKSEVSNVTRVDDRDVINEIRVMERTPAKIETPVSGGLREFKTVDEILLADGQVLYQCYRCPKTFATPRSAHSHAVNHATPKKITKKRIITTKKSSDDPSGTTSTRQRRSQAAEPADASRESITLRMNQLAERIARVSDQAHALFVEIRELAEDVAKIPVMNADTAEKARRFDELHSLINT